MYEITKAQLISMYEMSIAAHDGAKAALFELHGNKCDGSLETPLIKDHPQHAMNLEGLPNARALPESGCIFCLFDRGDENAHGMAVFDPRSINPFHYVIGYDPATKSATHLARPRQDDVGFWRWFENRNDAMLYKLAHGGE